MRFASYTAATILAYALVQAGAVPSPQESEAVSTDAPAAPTEEPVYYPEETDDAEVEKRDDKKIFKPARPFGGHYWKGLGDQTNHGPMPDEDSIDLTPYFDHPDPTIRAIASVAKRAPKETKNNQGVDIIQAPAVHWWQQDGAKDGKGINPIVGGNPNVNYWYNSKEQARWGKGLKAREADPDEHGPPGGQGGHWGGGQGGQGMSGGCGGEGDSPGGMGGGQGRGQGDAQGGPTGGMGGGQGGPPGGMGGGQGGQWGRGGGHGDRGHGPQADEQ